MSAVKKSCICAICIALCYIIPLALHPLGLGQILAPMHIPVLLCGLICGWGYGALCGIIGPVLSSVLSGMPTAAALVSMIPELGMYGLVSGICIRRIRSGYTYLDLYSSMLCAMLAGRGVGGIAKYLFYLENPQGAAFTLSAWISTYFVTSLPGILLQLSIVPTLVFVLMKARLIPERYGRAPSKHT